MQLSAGAFATVSWAGAMAAEAPPHLSLTIYNDDLALVEETRTLDPGVGRSKLEFKMRLGRNTSRDGVAERVGRRDRRAELRLRPAHTDEADGESGGTAGRNRPDQSGQRRAGNREGHGAVRQRRRRAAHRRSHRSPARGRRTHARHLRQGAGEPARATDAVRHGAIRARRQPRLHDSATCPPVCPGRPTTSRCSTRRPASSICKAGSRSRTSPAPPS